MKSLHLIALLLVIVGGLNWGLVGLANWNLVAALFGADSALSRIVYVLVGLSAAWLTAESTPMAERMADRPGRRLSSLRPRRAITELQAEPNAGLTAIRRSA